MVGKRLFRYNKRISGKTHMDTKTLPEPTFDAASLAQANTLQPEAVAPLFEWSALTHHGYERGSRWYMVAGGVAGLIACISLLTGAWSVAVVTVVIAGLYYFSRKHEAPLHRIRIDSTGFLFDDTFTTWRNCVDFWVVQTPTFSELHILRKEGSPREAILQTADINITVLRSTLSQYLPIRADQRERLLDALLRLCKL